MEFRRFQEYVRERAISSTGGWARRFFLWLDVVTSDYANLQAVGLWTAAILTGIVAVFYARFFRGIETLYFEIYHQHPILLPLLAPLFFLGAWYLVYRYAPEASGSGIPQVMTAIELDSSPANIAFVDRLLSIRTAFVKILSSLLCLAGGGAIGREGPTLQVAGAVFHFFGAKVRRFYPKSDEQTWVIAGAAAGLASAFNTPLGGIVYAIEELGMTHFRRIRTALLSGVIISGLMAQTLLGSYLYLGFPKLTRISGMHWFLVLLTGFVSGLLGALFSRGLLKASRWRQRWTSAKPLIFCALGTGGVAGLLVYFSPSLQGPGTEVISNILFDGQMADIGLVVGRIVATSVAYLSGAAGGIFSPSLSIGASVGSMIASLFGSEHGNLLAMLGMIGFLTGVTQTPFTSFILVMEMSDRHSAIFPMMVTALIANSVAKSIQKQSFYESVRDDWMRKAKGQSPKGGAETPLVQGQEASGVSGSPT